MGGINMNDLASDIRGVVLSGKEIEILRFIHEFGFCEIKQIMKRFAMTKTPAYLHMQILMRLGLVIHARFIPGQAGSYYLTHKAVSLLELDLPIVRKISRGTYEHHLAVIDIHLRLKELHHDAVWITERRLLRNKYADRSSQNEHLPDGVLIFADGIRYAIEVELSMKTKKRLEEILLGYGLQNTFKEVWYFCSPITFHIVNELAQNMPYVRTYNNRE